MLTLGNVDNAETNNKSECKLFSLIFFSAILLKLGSGLALWLISSLAETNRTYSIFCCKVFEKVKLTVVVAVVAVSAANSSDL